MFYQGAEPKLMIWKLIWSRTPRVSWALVLPEGAEVTVCARKMKYRSQILVILVGSTIYCLVMCSQSGVVFVWMPSLHKDSFICRQAD